VESKRRAGKQYANGKKRRQMVGKTGEKRTEKVTIERK